MRQTAVIFRREQEVTRLFARSCRFFKEGSSFVATRKTTDPACKGKGLVYNFVLWVRRPIPPEKQQGKWNRRASRRYDELSRGNARTCVIRCDTEPETVLV